MQQWNDLNNVQLIFCWLQISVMHDWILTDQILLCISFEYLILHQDSLIFRLFSSYQVFSFKYSHTTTHPFTTWTTLYIYLSNYQVGSNNLANNHYNSRLEIIKHQTRKSLYWPTLHGELCSETNSCVNRLSSVKDANSVKSFNHRVNLVSTKFPVMTEWARWKLPFGDRVKLS